MKNVINYYYSMYPNKLYQNKDEYYFYHNNIKYSLIKYDGDIENINDIYNMHLSILNRTYLHQIILNKDSSPITIYNHNNYILIQILDEKDINIDDIISFNKLYAEKKELNWGKMWSKKNDYLEFQISKLGTNFKLLKDSFSYYIGLGETAIAIYNTEVKETSCVFSHKRINRKEKKYDYYNPLNIIVDSKVRDAAEYLKYNFYEGIDIEPDMYYYLNNSELNKDEYIAFLARMMYPTIYFDYFEEIITGREEEKTINKIVDKTEQYQNIIKKLYQYYKSFLNITPIEWLD